jgi:hypothetical protein
VIATEAAKDVPALEALNLLTNNFYDLSFVPNAEELGLGREQNWDDRLSTDELDESLGFLLGKR